MTKKTKQTIAYFLTTAIFVLLLEYLNDTMGEGDEIGFFIGNFVFTYFYGFLMITIYEYKKSKTFTFTLNSTGRGWVNKTGYTLLGVREGHDVLDDPLIRNLKEKIMDKFDKSLNWINDKKNGGWVSSIGILILIGFYFLVKYLFYLFPAFVSGLIEIFLIVMFAIFITLIASVITGVGMNK
jgi:hypothetical protein